MSRLVYFTMQEFNCPCCGVEMMDRDFVELIDQIRATCGFPFIINSGWRCEAHNKDIGGVENSAHLRGTAVDIKCMDSKRRELIDAAAVEFGIRRRGLAKSFIHLDVDKILPSPRLWFY